MKRAASGPKAVIRMDRAENRTHAPWWLVLFALVPVMNVAAALLLASRSRAMAVGKPGRPAPSSKRIAAGAVDAAIAYALMLVPGVGWLAALLFCLFRDCVFSGGRSPGKLLLGIAVSGAGIDRLSPLDSFMRNFLTAIPVLQIPAALAEAAALLATGRRMGDGLSGLGVEMFMPKAIDDLFDRAAPAGESGIFLSVVIPAFNEEKRIGPTLDRVAEYLAQRGIAGEIVVVDDGSRDRTAEIVLSSAQAHPSVRLVGNGRNRGKGYTVRNGVANSKGRFVLFSDADLSTPIEEFDKLLPVLEGGAGVAFASRAMAASSIEKAQPILRRLMGRVFNLVVRAAALPGVRDSQCGFKCFTAEAARRIFPIQRIEGFAFDVELLFLARRLKFRIEEVPVRWIDSPDSRVRRFTDPLRMLVEIFKIRMNSLTGIYGRRAGDGGAQPG